MMKRSSSYLQLLAVFKRWSMTKCKLYAAYVLVMILCLTTTACSNNTTRLQKYDAKADDSAKAVVVVGTQNVSYFDLHRYGTLASAEQPAASKQKKAPSNSNKNNNAAKIKEEKQVESADPTKLDYTKSSFNLRRLWDPNAPKTLDGHMDNDNTQDNELYQQDDSSATETPVQTTAAASEYRIHKQSRIFGVFSYAKSIYNIEPGIYYISFAYYDHNSSVSYTRLPGVTDNGVVQYAAFEIKAGDVLYLGDISFDWVNLDKPNMISVHNNFTEVKRDLIEEGHKNLAVKIAQAKLYPYGSKISKEPDNRFIIN